MADNPTAIPTQARGASGGPAFPSPLTPGMSLRDYFAAQVFDPHRAAMGIAGLATEQIEAERSYRMADALLRARELAELPIFPWNGSDPQAFEYAGREVLRAIDAQAEVFMANNPQGTPQERAIWHAGWMFRTVALAAGMALYEKNGLGGVAMLKIYDACKPIMEELSARVRAARREEQQKKNG